MTLIRSAAGVLALLFVLMPSASQVAAQSASDPKIAKAHEVFRVGFSDAIRQELYYQTQIVFTMGFNQMYPDVRSEDALRILKEELDKEVDQNLPRLADQVVAVLVEDFTEEELDALWQAEESPARQSMMAKMPTVAEEIGELANAWRQPIVLAVLRAVDQRLPKKRKVQQPKEEGPLE